MEQVDGGRLSPYSRRVQTRELGRTKRAVPVIGQGTWHLESGDAAAAIAALRRGFDLGMTHVDTAELYGSGKVETILQKALAGRRDEVFLVSKVMPSNASAKGTRRACEASLQRLGTDRLDCFLLHWPGSHPLEDTLEAFEQLEREGKILSWGVSNFDETELEEALAIVGPGRIACNQVLYHLEERGIEHAVLPFCEAHGIAVVGYTPFGSSGFPPRGRGKDVLLALAASRGVTPRQVALAFLTRRPACFAIPKASSVRHTEENAGAGDLQLSADEIAQLDAAFPLGRRRSGVAML